MRMQDRTSMTAAWMKVKRLCDMGDQVRSETDKAIGLVMGNEDTSDSFKARQVSRLRQEAAGEYRRLSETIWNTMSSIDDMEQAVGGGGDYTSPRLAAALNVIKMLGKATPVQVQERILNDFVGDEMSLRCVKAVFDGAGLVNADVDRYLTPFTTLDNMAAEAAGELRAYAEAENSEWRPAAVRAAADRAARGWGLDFSQNPYLVEMEHIKANTSDPAKAAQIGRWVASHGGAVYEDGCVGGPSELAEATLEDWRSGEGE